MNEYEVIIVGLGAVGSAVLYELARREEWIVGLERRRVPHNPGLSYGATQPISAIDTQDPPWERLVSRAGELWQGLQQSAAHRILYPSGSLHAGAAGDAAVEEAKRVYEENHISYQVLSGSEVNDYFPGFQLPEDMEAVFRADGGFLLSERAAINQVALGLSLGANIRPRERALEWEPTALGVKVTTDKDTYSARKLVVCAREWTDRLLPQLARRPRVQRQSVGWFRANSPWLVRQDVFPAFEVSAPEGRFSGVPDYGQAGFKIAHTPQGQQPIDPDYVDRQVHRDDETRLWDFAGRYVPEAARSALSFSTTEVGAGAEPPLILDTLPGFPQVTIAAGFSGRNMLLSNVAAEILADLAQNDETDYDTSMFRLDRLQ